MITDRKSDLLGPLAVIVAVALIAAPLPSTVQLQFQLALVQTAMVVSVHVFVGNSGVISFGNIGFVALGAFAAGIMSLEAEPKSNIFPELFAVIQQNQLGNIGSLVLAAAVGGIFAAIVGLALMRLNGLAAGIATFAVLGITRNVLRNWTKVGPGAKTLPGVPETTGMVQATIGLVLVVVVAYGYQRSRFGRRLRATREDPSAARAIGINIYSERLIAFVLSGVLGGLAGGLYVRLLGSITTEQVYLELTFLTLSMLVIGGLGSLWGAIVGGLLISGLGSALFQAQSGFELGGITVQLPAGTQNILIGFIMVLVLILRPTGIVRGEEFGLRFQLGSR